MTALNHPSFIQFPDAACLFTLFFFSPHRSLQNTLILLQFCVCTLPFIVFTLNYSCGLPSYSSFFLEKNMLAFFLRFMRQKLGRYICVQLLQLLNILFENIRNETSVCKSSVLVSDVSFCQPVTQNSCNHSHV